MRKRRVEKDWIGKRRVEEGLDEKEKNWGRSWGRIGWEREGWGMIGSEREGLRKNWGRIGWEREELRKNWMRKRRIEEGLEEGLDEIEKDWGRMGRERKRLKKIELDKEEKY